MPFSILVHVGADLVGDGLMKLPFVRALRSCFPDAHIRWLAGQGGTVYAGSLAPVVAGLLDEVVAQDLRGFVKAQRARATRFDLIIDTQRGLATAWRLRRLKHGIFISPGTNFLLSSIRPRNYRKPKSLIRQLVDLVELAAGRDVAVDAPLAIPAELAAEAARLLPAGPTYVGLCPGAGGRHKCWPLDRYVDLARRVRAAGLLPIVLLGPAEADWVAEVRAALPDVVLPLQATELGSPLLTIALGQRLGGAVANDSGLGHMMANAGIPLVSLFGPTPPDKFAPMTRTLRIVRAQDFGAEDMSAIPVEAVESALLAIVARTEALTPKILDPEFA